MNVLVWILQILAALLYVSSGIMKLFLFDKISHDVPSFGALPRNVWHLLGVLELVCAAGLILPGAIHWHASLTVAAAAILAVESLVFIGVHLKYPEKAPLVMSAVLGFLMLFVTYGRYTLAPLH